MKKIFLSVLMALSLIVTLSGCGTQATKNMATTDTEIMTEAELDTDIASNTETKIDDSPEKNQISNIASFENCILELGEASIDSSSGDEKVVKINAVYTNNGEEPLYAACSFVVRAFQNDIEIEDCSNINGDESSLIKEVKSGESINVTYAFRFVEDSAVEVLIGEPTADQVTIGRKIYFED